ncbi:hypothetical protein [Fusibacter ferrireducens]|uniref:Uncharacterized protein n=1 Tax=Fusibacter ferrireducens TaxID=2785058 RepID=A0ABR9ZNX1_9FIRM|nr:hypothetical protein [Fusibacter ferrireducens]MBF4692141.1 hypothetical protein [Fusibacter ferrireducens]
MIPSIRVQNTTRPHPNSGDINAEQSISGPDFSETLTQVTTSLEKKEQVDRFSRSEAGTLTRADMLNIIQGKIFELKDKLENGDTEPTYQIGSNAFTKKEWDNLIYKVDRALEKDEDKLENKDESKEDDAIHSNDQKKS